jgi:hypothetical protein
VAGRVFGRQYETIPPNPHHLSNLYRPSFIDAGCALRPLLPVLAFASIAAGPAPETAPNSGKTVLTFSGSALGARGRWSRSSSRSFSAEPRNPRRAPTNTGRCVATPSTLRAVAQRARRQSAILQLDVGLDTGIRSSWMGTPARRAYGPSSGEFFPATIEANSWAGKLYALPGSLTWDFSIARTDLLPTEPATLSICVSSAHGRDGATRRPEIRNRWQGARYEGLITLRRIPRRFRRTHTR